MGEPQKCPANYYCPEGSTAPEECAIFHNSNEGASVCTLSWKFWVVVTSIILLFIVLLLIIFGVAMRITYVKKKKQRKTLLTKEPVYDGY